MSSAMQSRETADLQPPAKVENPQGKSPFILICEHASPYIPEQFSNLGLSGDLLTKHIAWDPGAYDTALAMSKILDAPLVHSTVSRLVYDCNRPPSSPGAMPESSEQIPIPGNHNLSTADKAMRVDAYYRPFEALVAQVVEDHGPGAIIVTIHSFTPTFLGKERLVELGILHDTDTRLADALLSVAGGYDIQRNAPYGPEDGVTHTLARHALPNGLLNVMVEIRNDLIATPDQCASMAQNLAGWLEECLSRMNLKTASGGA